MALLIELSVCNVNDIFPEKISLIYIPIHIILSTIQRVLSVRSYFLGNLQGVTSSEVSFCIARHILIPYRFCISKYYYWVEKLMAHKNYASQSIPAVRVAICYTKSVSFMKLNAAYMMKCDQILVNSSKSHMKSNVFLHVFNNISTYVYVFSYGVFLTFFQ